ncbi:hypothetical protein [Catenulispora subtropica]|uniref:hypothetical protein n=1 Tax=Catenulispora subtropica TaxID=450798 RepID=UPI0031D21240
MSGPSALPAFVPSSPIAGEAVHSFFPASAAQFTDGAQFTTARLKAQAAATSACLAKAGTASNANPDVDATSAAEIAMAGVDTVDFPDLDRISSERAFVPPIAFPPAAAPRVPASAPATPTDSGRAAAQRCRQSSAALFPVQNAAGPLTDQWWAGVRRIQSSQQVRAVLPAFRDCLAESGAPADQIPLTSSGEAFGHFLAWENGADQAAATSAAITANDQRWAPVFAACAKPVMQVVEPMTLQAQQVFLHDNARQVQQLEAMAESELQAARR